MKTIAELVNQHAPPDELRHLRAENSRLTKILQSRKVASGQISEAMKDVLTEVSVWKPGPASWRPAKKESRVGRPVVQVAHITDWHIGEVTRPSAVEDFGQADFETASARIGRLVESLVRKVTLTRHAYNADELHVLGTADWVSGDIHDELIRTNEFPAPVAAVRAGFLLGSFLSRLAPHYRTVTADLITAGNHDRLTRKPQSSDGGLNSWGYVVCEIAKQHLAQHRNVAVRVHTALSAVVKVAGTRYLITHGDGIMGTWGIPFYGIERRKQREAMARMNLEDSRHFDKIVIGHFHEALNHQHWLIGGNLSGTTAHDHKQGRHALPHQTSWFVHPAHGEFDWTRWWL